jgi:hypothetical protein
MIVYTPTTERAWLLFAGSHAALMVDAAATASRPIADRVDDLYAAVRSDGAIQSVLDTLTAGGLSSVPPFVLASWDAAGTLHLLVRGAGTVVVETGAGVEKVDSSAVSTWVERVITDARSIRAGGAADIPAGALPLGEGVVWASSIVVEVAAPEVTTAEAPAVEAPTAEVAVAAAPPTAAPERIAPPPLAPAVTVPAGTVPVATVPTVAPIVPPVVVPVTPLLVPPAPGQADTTSTIEISYDAALAENDAVSEEDDTAPEVDDSVVEETDIRSIDDLPVYSADGYELPKADAPADEAPVTTDALGDHDGETIMSGSLQGDHDGETIMSGDLVGRRAARSAAGDSAPRVPEARKVFLELSTGTREALTDTIIVGRAPSVSQVSSGHVPRLVTIPGDQDISRSHAQFTLEGDTAVVTDLHSRNGTSIILPGKAPQLLRQGEPTAVLVGTVVDLGGGITVTVTDNV